MAWTVGIEELYVGDICIEGQWEVDESSEVDAMNTDKIPYLLVGVDLCAYPEPQVIEWCSSNQLDEYAGNGGYFVTGESTHDGEQAVVLLTAEQVTELANVMDKISEDVSMGDFV